jgi:hypothetical protein
MNFKQLIGQYALGNLLVEQLPELAYKGLEEGFESPSLIMLAGIEKNESSFVIEQYFKSALAELRIKIPERRNAALEYATIIAQEIIDGKKEVFDGVGEIISKVIRTNDFESDTTQYLYDGIFFDNVYGCYYNYDDLENPLVQISKGDSREALIVEAREKLLKKLIIWKDKIEASGLIR